jgi:hypothetical protein
MEVHDPPNHARYCELVCPSAAGRIEFLSFSPATCLRKLNFRVADDLPRTWRRSAAPLLLLYEPVHMGSFEVSLASECRP